MVKSYIDEQVSSLIMYSTCTMGFSHHKFDVADILFEILEVWGTGSIME